MSDADARYRSDFLLWSKQQAAMLRAEAQGGSNQKLDWENLAEEIESLGISQRSGFRSQIGRIIEHLLKLENSVAADPRRGWVGSVLDARSEIERMFEDSPSLKREVSTMLRAEMPRASRRAIADLEDHGKLGPGVLARIRGTTYSEDQVLGDWLPPKGGSER